MTTTTTTQSSFSRISTLLVLLAFLAAPTASLAGQQCDPNPNPTKIKKCNSGSDVDEDGVCDHRDNCEFDFNPEQSDSDGDELGNACDCDYDNDGVVGRLDFMIFQKAYNSGYPNGNYDTVTDHNCDNFIGEEDFNTFLSALE